MDVILKLVWKCTLYNELSITRMTRFNFFVFKLTLLLVGSTLLPSFAGALLVTWDSNKESDLAGYRIYYGIEQSNYANMIDVGNRTSYTIRNLEEGQTYFIVVTAYDLSGNESVPSDEASAIVRGAQALAEVAPEGIHLRWSPISGADAYAVYKDSDPYFQPTSPVATISTTEYLDSSHPKLLGVGTYYIVRALSQGNPIYQFSRLGAFNVILSKGYNLISLPLVPESSSLSRILGSQLNGSTNSIFSDKVLYWKGGDYEVAWLVEGTSSSFEGKWVSEAGDQESPINVNPDRSFWIVLRNNIEDSCITITGEVSSDPNRVITLTKGPNFVGSCYPASVHLDSTDLVADGVVIGGTYKSAADNIMKWLSDRYEIAWLVGNTQTHWDGKWMNEGGTDLSTICFTPGEGYILWIKNDNASNIWTYPNQDPNF